MTAEEIGVKAALGLLPFATGAEYAGRDPDAVLANLKSRPGFSEAMGAGTVVLEDARKALAFRSRLVRMESSMMASVVKDEARRCLHGLDPFGQAGFMKEWPSAESEFQ